MSRFPTPGIILPTYALDQAPSSLRLKYYFIH